MDWANEIEVQRRAFEVWRRAALIVLHENDHEIVLDEAARLDLPAIQQVAQPLSPACR